MVTNTIIEKLEEGLVPWKRPWNGLDAPKNVVSKKEYQGINRFLLDLSPFDSNYWITYKQAKKLGGDIKKGSRYSPIVFWNWIKKEDPYLKKEVEVPIFRFYKGFNLKQTSGLDGLIEELKTEEEKGKLEFNPISACEQLINSYPNAPPIKYEGNMAYYHPAKDEIVLPPKEHFHNVPEFYSTVYHEAVHSTGSVKRLNRKGITVPTHFASYEYSKEELIAEMGSSFLCKIAGIDNDTLDNSASYIQGWLKKIKDDKKLVVVAAAQAEKAVGIIRGEYLSQTIKQS